MGGGSRYDYYPKDYYRQVEKSTGDEMIERGMELSLWARLRRWLFGW